MLEIYLSTLAQKSQLKVLTFHVYIKVFTGSATDVTKRDLHNVWYHDIVMEIVRRGIYVSLLQIERRKWRIKLRAQGFYVLPLQGTVMLAFSAKNRTKYYNKQS